MAGQIAPDNANQLVNAVHQMAVLLNLAGYQLEGVALAAYNDNGSAGIYINLAKAEYTVHTASASTSTNALEHLIGKDFPEDEDVCIALRITPPLRCGSRRAPSGGAHPQAKPISRSMYRSTT